MLKYVKANLNDDEYRALTDAFLSLYLSNRDAYDLAVTITKFLSVDEFESFMRVDYSDIYDEIMYPEEFEG